MNKIVGGQVVSLLKIPVSVIALFKKCFLEFVFLPSTSSNDYLPISAGFLALYKRCEGVLDSRTTILGRFE